MRLDLPILLDDLLDAFWPDGDAGALPLPGTMGHARLADGGPTATAPWDATLDASGGHAGAATGPREERQSG
jgi:hypothetical protein